MRRGKSVIAALLLSLIAVSALFAQGTSIAGFAGLGMPMGPEFLKENWKNGLGFGGDVRFHLNERTAISVGYMHQTFKADLDKISEIVESSLDLDELDLSDYLDSDMNFDYSFSIEGLNVKANIITANLIYYLTPPSSGTGLYLTGGAGYYMMGLSDAELKYDYSIDYLGIQYSDSGSESVDMSDSDENKMGINGGLGFEFLFGANMFLFVEGRYHYIFTDFDDVEETFGMESGKASFISIMGGLRIPLGN